MLAFSTAVCKIKSRAQEKVWGRARVREARSSGWGQLIFPIWREETGFFRGQGGSRENQKSYSQGASWLREGRQRGRDTTTPSLPSLLISRVLAWGAWPPLTGKNGYWRKRWLSHNIYKLYVKSRENCQAMFLINCWGLNSSYIYWTITMCCRVCSLTHMLSDFQAFLKTSPP